MNKLNNLLAREDIVNYLDQIKQDKESNQLTHFELFKESKNDYDQLKRSSSNPKNIDFKVLESLEEKEEPQRLLTKNYSVKQFKKSQSHFFFEDYKKKYEEEVSNVDKKMIKIEANIKMDVENQNKHFEEIKKKKLERISSKKSKHIKSFMYFSFTFYCDNLKNISVRK